MKALRWLLPGGVYGLVVGVAGTHVLEHPIKFVVLVTVLCVTERVQR